MTPFWIAPAIYIQSFHVSRSDSGTDITHHSDGTGLPLIPLRSILNLELLWKRRDQTIGVVAVNHTEPDLLVLCH